MKFSQYFLIGIASLMSAPSFAQWQWIDHDGHRVFSDRAPPPDIADKNILNRPVVRAAKNDPPTASAAGLAGSAAAASQASGAASAPKISGADRELMEKKKLAEQEQNAKRQAEQERVLKTKIENCSRAKQAKATLDSGMRMGRMNEKGEREVLDDGARATEIKRIQTLIEADCK
jgi:hypothetical protein